LPELVHYRGFGIGNALTLGVEYVPEGTSLTVARRWNVQGWLFITLSKPGCPGSEYSLCWFFKQADSYYVILKYPPDLTGDDDIIPCLVVKLLDANTIMTISDSELIEVASACIREIASRKHCVSSDLCGAMGVFPDITT
jgi:hypothetical protein